MTTASIMGVAMAFAQNIAVVSENGNTTIWTTLQEAIENATNGSIIYLSDGGYQINDDVKITKKLIIIGKGYKPKSGNADGRTAILGNLWFNGQVIWSQVAFGSAAASDSYTPLLTRPR